jgi:septal ring factor EnvC (AmiA/AmiB activator)
MVGCRGGTYPISMKPFIFLLALVQPAFATWPPASSMEEAPQASTTTAKDVHGELERIDKEMAQVEADLQNLHKEQEAIKRQLDQPRLDGYPR